MFRVETDWKSAEGSIVINFDEEARDDELILILISSILLQKKSQKSFALKGAKLNDWFMSKFSHSVEEKSKIVFIIYLLGWRNMLF